MKIGRNNLMPPNSITSPDVFRRAALGAVHGAGVQRRPLFLLGKPKRKSRAGKGLSRGG